MLYFVVLSLLLATRAIAQSEVESFKSINLEETFKTETPKTECVTVDPSNILFSLYTRNTPYDGEILRTDDNGESVRNSDYNVKKSTKILIHSWLQSANSIREMVPDYLYWKDINVIIVDWSKYAKQCNLKSTQDVVMPKVAKVVATLMKELIAYGSTAEENIHIVGHSVGAHIAGQVAKILAPVKLNRISALDPIGYEFNEPGRWKLQNSDALFVDVIYTSIPSLATDRDVGHVTVYPDGGKHPQPGCNDDVICSSLKSIEMWRKSILRPMKAWKCNNYDSYKSGACKQVTENMGEHISNKARGKYFLNFFEHTQEYYNEQQ